MNSNRIGKNQDKVDLSKSISLPILQQNGKLVPKHLNVEKKRVNSMKKLRYQEPIKDRIRRERKKALKPLNDIEVILKKFDQVVEDKKSLMSTPKKMNALSKRFETDLDKKIQGLLSLPTVKNIKIQAQEYRMKTQGSNPIEILFSEANRINILKNYEDYIKSSSKPVESRRIKTEIPSPTLSPFKL